MEEKKCKYCAMMIPKEAKICPHCRKKQKGISTGIGCLVIIIATIAIVGLINLSSENKTPSTSDISVGKEGHLDSGAELCPVAINEKAFDDWTKARIAKDDRGQVLLMANGKVFTVKSGTKILLVDQSMFKRKVRVLEGDQKGMSGWVAMEYVK